MAEPTEERHQEPSAGGGGEDVVYRTKTIEFLGRSTPIVLQNDNGPCPLLAICNVLLLRNSLHIGADAPEVPLQKLLSLLAEKLIDSNSNVQDKDEVYVTNQQQNIADAIDLLPHLATGIDVNVQFRKVNDFEFTRECAIFDLLDIGLYHGWIVDPQDTDTLAAIESKSYNALVAELVDYETRRSEREDKSTIEEDCVDFVAATTAALGVPSPSLSRGRSFDDCPVVLPAEKLQGKGDKEEEAELIRALNLSKTVTPNSVNVSLSPDVNCGSSYMSTEEVAETKSSGPEPQVEPVVVQFADESGRSHQPDLIEPEECDASSDCKANGLDSESLSAEHDTTSASIAVETDVPVIKESEDSSSSRDSKDNERADARMQNQEPTCHTADGDGSNGSNSCESLVLSSGEDQSVTLPCNEDFSTLHSHNKPTDNLQNYNSPHVSGPNDANPLSTNEKEVLSVTSEVVNLGLEDREPIYEGEEHMLDSGLTVYENREPVYEGEMILAEQADKKEIDARSGNSIHSIHPQGQLIKNFLESSASQLTIYGLFCLQDSLKERELCVFFRNNHFSTMFKFNGELYLLATDQGYINQPDLVWEKLNEVNGDTVFMTGNFTEFKAENPVNDSWSEQSAMTSTADYLATLEGSSPSRSAMNSDLQLAIALQQQEFEQQQQPQGPQRHQQQSSQQSSVNARSRLVTGPQAPRPSHAPQRSESKSKDKCTIM